MFFVTLRNILKCYIMIEEKKEQGIMRYKNIIQVVVAVVAVVTVIVQTVTVVATVVAANFVL